MSADAEGRADEQTAPEQALRPKADAGETKHARPSPAQGQPPAGEEERSDVSAEEAFAALEQDAAEAVDELSGLRAEVEHARDRALRAQAELENVRKRAQREIMHERRYAATPLIRDLLVVADNVDRAIAAAEQTGQNSGLVEGFRMVADQLHSTLEKHGCTRIAADGRPFDPHLHEAISQQPTADYPPGTVVHVALSGYQLHDRVVRPAQVVVSAEPVEPQPQETAADGDQ
jgi:molecular chaperone GrpE